MRDPLLIVVDEPPEKRLPDDAKLAWYGTPENPKPRSDEKLRGDVIRAFDDLHDVKRKVYKIADTLLAELIQTQKQLKRANYMIWVAALVIGPIFNEVLKWILKRVF